MNNDVCQVCDLEAKYVCGDCKTAKYCSEQHRNEHWRTHKEQCKVIRRFIEKQSEDKVNKKRQEIRKRYFQNFGHMIYDQCIVVARELLALQKSHIQVTREIFNEFQYGAAVCLLCRTYIMNNRLTQASQEINNYIRDKYHFLEDMRHIPTFKPGQEIPQRTKAFLQKKLSLISAVANIYHALKRNCIEYYNMYTKHIELAFGSQSKQLSNAFFCVGCYYKEIHQYTKSIACFIRAASLRGKKGGDCFVNLSLLYRKIGKIQTAINMMSNAIKLNEEQFGSNSRQVAEVYEKLGLLYLDIIDFDNAILNMENALKIYMTQKESDEYKRVKEKITIIYNEVKKQTEKDAKEKKFIKKQEEDQANRLLDEKRLAKDDFIFTKHVELDKIFKISDSFTNKLNKLELYQLSELQLQLQSCRSQFAVAQTIGRSQFLKNLQKNSEKFSTLKNENEKLFQLITIEQRMQEEKKEETH